MDAERLHRWLNLSANVAVFIGLILVTMELYQNREIVRAQTRDQIATTVVEMQVEIATNPQLVEVMDRANRGEELSTAEALQVFLAINAIIRSWENVHYQYRSGLYDDIEFDAQRKAWRTILESGRAFTEFWCQQRTLFSPAFAADLENLLPKDSCTPTKKE